APLPDVKVGSASVKSGSLIFRDAAVSPNFEARVESADATVKNIDLRSSKPVSVDAKCLVNKSPLVVKGKVSPFGKKLDMSMTASLTTLGLPSFSPYSTEYTGYPITKGHMSYTGKYDVAQDALTSSNKVVVDQITFGNPPPNPKANLPVGLAVALLADRKGVIDVDIPVNGALSDPSFSFAGTVFQVIGNFLAKAVTSPFSLLAAMIPDFGGDELGLMAFEPGRDKMPEATAKSLGGVAKALADRPALKVQVTGVATPEADGAALRELELGRRIAAAVYKDAKGAADGRKLTAEQASKAIAQLYEAAPKQDKPAADEAGKRAWLLQQIEVKPDQLMQLAGRRADTMKAALVKQSVDPARIFVLAPVISAAAQPKDAKPGAAPRAGVQLNLQ
ncbi:MAG: DUF748 domain-containing protein, partial [Duodenibacillus sp.]|nr:DUF748 domain-containing protein [Duodenibacillus sp.]